MKKLFAVLLFLSVIIYTIYNVISIKNEHKRFGATFMTLNNPYFVQLNNGLKKAVEAKGDKYISLDPQLNNEKQVAIINDLIAQKVSGIFLNPVDWKGISPALRAANKAGIPVYVIDAPVFDDHLVVTTIASDNKSAGEECAKHLVNVLGITRGSIVMIEHPAAKSAMERTNGFLEYIKKYPELKVIAKESSDGQLEKAMIAMENVIRTRPEITAVMALNDPSALGVIAALERADKLGMVKAIYGVDGSADAVKMIKSGKLTATAAQYPEEIGRIAAEEAYKHLSGKMIQHEIKVPVKLITKDDM